jgi:hypothetical protein
LEKASPSLGRSAIYLKESRIDGLPRYNLLLLIINYYFPLFIAWKPPLCGLIGPNNGDLPILFLNYADIRSKEIFVRCPVHSLWVYLNSYSWCNFYFLSRYLTIQFVRFFWKRESNQKAKILRVMPVFSSPVVLLN